LGAHLCAYIFAAKPTAGLARSVGFILFAICVAAAIKNWERERWRKTQLCACVCASLCECVREGGESGHKGRYSFINTITLLCAWQRPKLWFIF